jgi:hypothetical protein
VHFSLAYGCLELHCMSLLAPKAKTESNVGDVKYGAIRGIIKHQLLII